MPWRVMADRSRTELAELLTLSRVPGVGSVRFTALIDAFGSAGAALSAGPERLASVSGIPGSLAADVASAEPAEDVGAQCDRIIAAGATILACTDADYPPQLAVLDDAPALLFVVGRADLLAAPGVAIVGTRRPSNYGRHVTAQIVRRLTEHGMVVFSGMARGVDSLAHKVALNGGGATVAVLGCGVDVVYPPEAKDLHSRIVREGAVVSELWMGATPEAVNFPRRNRIISGLAQAVVVTEAPRKSGALITAGTAMNQGRDVYAVPADITRPHGEGCNRLIANGAQAVVSADDLLASLGLATTVSTPDGVQIGLPVKPPPDISEEWRTIFAALEVEPVHIDVLAARLESTPSKLLPHLMNMEMRDLVEQHPGSRFSRAVTTG